jgi:hypothetical protein
MHFGLVFAWGGSVPVKNQYLLRLLACSTKQGRISRFSRTRHFSKSAICRFGAFSQVRPPRDLLFAFVSFFSWRRLVLRDGAVRQILARNDGCAAWK